MAEDRDLWWVNCCDLGSEEFLGDKERMAIDAMGEALGRLDDKIVKIRRLVTRFESCYLEAGKEAKSIVRAIGSGECPAESGQRPAQRKRQLQEAKEVLSAWLGRVDVKLGTFGADEARVLLGERTDLKQWQVQRVVEKVAQALDPDEAWCNLAVDGGKAADERYAAESEFLQRTRLTIIKDTIDGKAAEISLAMAIDLLRPCNWNFAGCLRTILGAIGGQFHPERPLTCCARSLSMSPHCQRLRVVSATLAYYWQDGQDRNGVDRDLLRLLGEKTAVKQWLAACFDKTIRYQLAGDFPLSLI